MPDMTTKTQTNHIEQLDRLREHRANTIEQEQKVAVSQPSPIVKTEKTEKTGKVENIDHTDQTEPTEPTKVSVSIVPTDQSDLTDVVVSVASKAFKDTIVSETSLACIKRRFEAQTIVLDQLVKRAKTTINCVVGVYEEERHVSTKMIKDTQRTFSRRLSGSCHILFGKVDGFDNDKNQVIEIKTRQKRLYRKLWPHEIVQAMCYMYMSGATSTRLIEIWNGNTFEMRYDFRPDDWSKIQFELVRVCQEINDILCSSAPTQTDVSTEIINHCLYDFITHQPLIRIRHPIC
jgi:hypothetical protein